MWLGLGLGLGFTKPLTLLDTVRVIAPRRQSMENEAANENDCVADFETEPKLRGCRNRSAGSHPRYTCSPPDQHISPSKLLHNKRSGQRHGLPGAWYKPGDPRTKPSRTCLVPSSWDDSAKAINRSQSRQQPRSNAALNSSQKIRGVVVPGRTQTGEIWFLTVQGGAIASCGPFCSPC